MNTEQDLFYPLIPTENEKKEAEKPTEIVLETESDKGKTELSISPERGGMVTKFSVQNKNILYYDPQDLTNNKKPKMGVPVLFPFAGPDKEDKVRQHGGLRELPWILEEQTENSATVSISTKNINDQEILKELQNKFGENLDFTYQVKTITKNNILRYEIIIKNNGKDEMPTAPGLHPYFKVDHNKQPEITSNLEGFDPNHTWKDDQKGALKLNRPQSEDVWFTIPDVGKITIKSSEEFKKFLVWSKTNDTTGEKEDYICIEPWIGGVGAIDNPEERLIIPPGGEKKLIIEFVVEINN